MAARGVKVILTRRVPQKAVARAEVRGSEDATLADMLAWAESHLRGTLWWSQTQFRDPRTSRAVCLDSRKRHFADGYWVYRFWFSRKADAALFLLRWDALHGARA